MTPYFREMVEQYAEGDHEFIYVDVGDWEQVVRSEFDPQETKKRL